MESAIIETGIWCHKWCQKGEISSDWEYLLILLELDIGPVCKNRLWHVEMEMLNGKGVKAASDHVSALDMFGKDLAIEYIEREVKDKDRV